MRKTRTHSVQNRRYAYLVATPHRDNIYLSLRAETRVTPTGAADVESEVLLVWSGQISAADYVDAVARREEERLPLGQVAIEEGLLAARQVLDLLCMQRDEPASRFGELAVSKGYLRPEQVATLLMHQQARQRPVMDHLVELGCLSAAEARLATQRDSPRRGRLLPG